MIHGPISRCLIKPSYSSWAQTARPRPTPSPHLLSCGGVLCGRQSPNRLLYDPYPMAARQAQLVTETTEGPIKSPRRIAAGHLLSTVADALWEILARTQSSTHKHTHAHSLCLCASTHTGRALMYERFDFGEVSMPMCVTRWCPPPPSPHFVHISEWVRELRPFRCSCL